MESETESEFSTEACSTVEDSSLWEGLAEVQPPAKRQRQAVKHRIAAGTGFIPSPFFNLCFIIPKEKRDVKKNPRLTGANREKSRVTAGVKRLRGLNIGEDNKKGHPFGWPCTLKTE